MPVLSFRRFHWRRRDLRAFWPADQCPVGGRIAEKREEKQKNVSGAHFILTFLRFSIRMSRTVCTSASLLVPVQTTLPFENSRNVAFFSGSL